MIMYNKRGILSQESWLFINNLHFGQLSTLCKSDIVLCIGYKLLISLISKAEDNKVFTVKRYDKETSDQES